MRYLLSCFLLQGRMAKWVFVLQEFDWEFVSPKITKAPALATLMTDLSPLFVSSPPKDDLSDDFLFIISMKDPWYRDILLYLWTRKFVTHLNHEDRWHIRHQAIRHLLIGDVLYHRGIDTILCRCLTRDKAETIFNDSHSGAYGGHLSGLAITQKILCASYFWPSIFADCIEAVKHCRSCHLFAAKARTPLHHYIP